jgi:hypothetical protein
LKSARKRTRERVRDQAWFTKALKTKEGCDEGNGAGPLDLAIASGSEYSDEKGLNALIAAAALGQRRTCS